MRKWKLFVFRPLRRRRCRRRRQQQRQNGLLGIQATDLLSLGLFRSVAGYLLVDFSGHSLINGPTIYWATDQWHNGGRLYSWMRNFPTAGYSISRSSPPAAARNKRNAVSRLCRQNVELSYVTKWRVICLPLEPRETKRGSKIWGRT